MINARIFNFVCVGIVVAAAIVFIIGPKWNEKNHHDFDQFYMGGVIARDGSWGSLYPVPVAGSNVNPGWPYGSRMKPRYEALAESHGVGSAFRFIQLPPNALLYYPLGFLSRQNAYRAWQLLMMFFLVIAAAQAGLIYRRMSMPAEPASVASGLVTLLVGCSPLMIYSAWVSNTGPLLAACFGATVLALLQPEGLGLGGGIAITLGGVTKYAPGVVVPLLVAMRRWRTLGWTIGLSLLVASSTAAVTGLEIWQEFWVKIWPALQKSSDSEAGQSLYSFLARVLHQFPLHHPAEEAIKLGQGSVLVLILCALIHRRGFWNVPAHVAAAAAALMAWLLIFSPVAWQFYHCMLTPLWGWLIWEGLRGRRWVKTAVGLAILLTLVPSPGNWWGRFPEPIASRQLFSAILILIFSVLRITVSSLPMAAPPSPISA